MGFVFGGLKFSCGRLVSWIGRDVVLFTLSGNEEATIVAKIEAIHDAGIASRLLYKC